MAKGSARVPLLFGAGGFGKPNENGARVHSVPEAQAMIEAYTAKGYDTIDTSRIYGGGASEEFIGQMNIRGCKVDTKTYPLSPGFHSPEQLQKTMGESEAALADKKINVYYLHYPDRSLDFEETLRGINELHKTGHFKEFGLSNFQAFEVAEFVTIARKNGWVQPTVYQGVYNALARTVEPELLPCLTKFGIRYYAYSPLAGGLLSGLILKESDFDAKERQGGRWDVKSFMLAEKWRKDYAPLLPIFAELKGTLDKHSITMPEAALRWLQHHSLLTPSDGVIIGARNIQQLEENISDSEKGPLPEEIVEILNQAWAKAIPLTAHYAF